MFMPTQAEPVLRNVTPSAVAGGGVTASFVTLCTPCVAGKRVCCRLFPPSCRIQNCRFCTPCIPFLNRKFCVPGGLVRC